MRSDKTEFFGIRIIGYLVNILEGDSRHLGYIGIIDQLTISDESRVRRENQILKIRADKADAALERIMQIEQQLGLDKNPDA